MKLFQYQILAEPIQLFGPPPVVRIPWNPAPPDVIRNPPFDVAQLTSGTVDVSYYVPGARLFQPFFASRSTIVYEPTFLIGGSGGQPADAQLYLNGVLVEWLANPGDADSTGNLTSGVAFSSPIITKILGQKGTLTFAFLSTNGTLPNAYDDVVFYRQGIRRFGGFITTVTDALIVDTVLREYGVSCVDYNGLLDRLVVAKYYTLPQSGIISIVLFDFWANFLQPDFGVTFTYFEFGDPIIEVGPLLFHYLLMSAAIAQLMQNASGWYVNIDAYKHMIFQEQGSGPTAPYALSDTSHNYESMAVTQDNSQYRNRQWVLPSVATQAIQVDSFDGDGSTTEVFTQYNLQQQPVVYLNGIIQRVTPLGSWSNPYDWYYIPGGQGIFQNPSNAPIGLLSVLTVAYPGPFQLAAMAENLTEIARVGLVENIYSPTDVVTMLEAQTMAEAILASYCPSIPSQVEFNTNEVIELIAGGWLEPGMMITVTNTAPLAAGAGLPYLVQQITSQENNLTVWKHNVIARLQNGATDYQSTLQRLTQAATTQPQAANTEVATFLLAQTIPAVNNPGLQGGPTTNVYIFGAPGTFASWTAVFQTAPVGTAAVIDAELNGVSILPAGEGKIIIEPGTSGVPVTGFQFGDLSAPVHYNAGDVLSLFILSAGGEPAFSGSDGVVSGNTFSAASHSFSTSDVGNAVTVGGTPYQITSVSSGDAILSVAPGDGTGLSWSINDGQAKDGTVSIVGLRST